MWSVQDPIWPPRVLTLEVKVCLETADECQWNVSKVQFVGKLILENHCQHWRFGIVGRADCHPKASVFDLKKMVISKFQVFYPHFYGIVQFRCVDQCCSQDHLNRDQVITKNSIPRNLDWSLKYNPESSLPWDQDQFQAVQHSFRRHRLVMATKAYKCVVLVGWSAWLRFT